MKRNNINTINNFLERKFGLNLWLLFLMRFPRHDSRYKISTWGCRHNTKRNQWHKVRLELYPWYRTGTRFLTICIKVLQRLEEFCMRLIRESTFLMWRYGSIYFFKSVHIAIFLIAFLDYKCKKIYHDVKEHIHNWNTSKCMNLIHKNTTIVWIELKICNKKI